MAFQHLGGGPGFQQGPGFPSGQFDIFEWHAEFQSCARYFLDHAQYSSPVQAVAAFVNIQLPFQKARQGSPPAGTPHGAASGAGPRTAGKPGLGSPSPHAQQPLGSVALIPYIRRLIVTGFDSPAVLHGFFGDDWAEGIGPLHEVERRNYLFAAKSDTWLSVKSSYDMADGQTVPFLRPLQSVSEKEIVAAETNWSEWLAMQDWMLGPRAPEMGGGRPRLGVKTEDD